MRHDRQTLQELCGTTRRVGREGLAKPSTDNDRAIDAVILGGLRSGVVQATARVGGEVGHDCQTLQELCRIIWCVGREGLAKPSNGDLGAVDVILGCLRSRLLELGETCSDVWDCCELIELIVIQWDAIVIVGAVVVDFERVLSISRGVLSILRLSLLRAMLLRSGVSSFICFRNSSTLMPLIGNGQCILHAHDSQQVQL